MDLSVVVPCYNEEESLVEMYRRVKAACDDVRVSYEIILVNDGSKRQDAGADARGRGEGQDSRRRRPVAQPRAPAGADRRPFAGERRPYLHPRRRPAGPAGTAGADAGAGAGRRRRRLRRARGAGRGNRIQAVELQSFLPAAVVAFGRADPARAPATSG